MKILHLISTLDPAYGGPVTGLSALCSSLGAIGARIAIVSLGGPDEPSIEVPNDVEVVKLGPGWGNLGSMPYRYTPELVPWLRANAPRFDAAVVHGIWQYQSFAAWRALRGRVPYFVFAHGALDPWFKRRYPLKHLKKWLYWPWAEYRVLRDAAAVLFTTDEERRLARESFRLYDVNEAVVNYGILAPEGDPEVHKEAFRATYPELSGKRLILFLSRLHEKKGCDLAIRGFAEISKHDPRLHLMMAGPDQSGMASDLRKLAERLGVADRVTWPGLISGDVKWGAYRSSEMFLLPSHSENFGIVVAEALACGLPVLISNKVNVWREIEAENAGLVANDDVEGTKATLCKWLAFTEDEKARYRRNAEQCFVGHFELRRNAAKFLALLASSVERHRSMSA